MAGFLPLPERDLIQYITESSLDRSPSHRESGCGDFQHVAAINRAHEIILR
jgi:hypothetical protein